MLTSECVPEVDDRPSLPAMRSSNAVLPPWPVTTFIGTLLIPFSAGVHVGSLWITPHRLLLLVALVPTSLALLTGRGGRLRAIDILFLFHAGWMAVALAAVHGIATGAESGGILAVEAASSYLIAKVYIRESTSFLRTARLLVLATLILPLVTVPESLLGKRILLDLVGRSAPPTADSFRFGLLRASGPFQHPILYGLFTASAFSLCWIVIKSRLYRIVAITGIVVATAVSFSSGAILAIAVQAGLLLWRLATPWLRHRWFVLAAIFVAIAISIQLVSASGALSVFLRYLTFNPQTSYMRLTQWEYGTEEVLRHPFTGLGFNDWRRPSWVPYSIDSFWLVTALKYGLPACLALIAVIALSAIRVGAREGRATGGVASAWVIDVTALAVAATTVHLWGTAFTYFCFFLGMASWVMDKRRAGRLPASRGESKVVLGLSR